MDDDGEGLNPQQEAAKRKALADKHQEDLINHMDAVTKRLHSNKKRGRKLFQRGLDTLEKSSKFAEFLKFDDAASFFYKSYISYKILYSILEVLYLILEVLYFILEVLYF